MQAVTRSSRRSRTGSRWPRLGNDKRRPRSRRSGTPRGRHRDGRIRGRRGAGAARERSPSLTRGLAGRVASPKGPNEAARPEADPPRRPTGNECEPGACILDALEGRFRFFDPISRVLDRPVVAVARGNGRACLRRRETRKHDGERSSGGPCSPVDRHLTIPPAARQPCKPDFFPDRRDRSALFLRRQGFRCSRPGANPPRISARRPGRRRPDGGKAG